MRTLRWFFILTVYFAGAAALAWADSVSYTGTLASSTDTFSKPFVVSGVKAEMVAIQTRGFGGGVNAAGTPIPAGGFDPFIAVFGGTGASAPILTDDGGNPFGTSDALSNFGSFTGCPPAGMVDLGGSVCGDVAMTLLLAPGAYTLVLSDANYIANAVFDNGTLGEGFADFTGGALQTCNTTDSGTNCAGRTVDWALDITTSSPVAAAPEPAAIFLLGGVLVGIGICRASARMKGKRI